ncbi:MAG TPA: hypothetical protein VL882_25395 [Vicinamibacterales bacterium]|jgi:hypothetical protein|nr:hypothetical protein [Vicinamibacterales bacterium]
MFNRMVLAAALALVAIPSTSLAQERATLTLRSGERLRAELMDLSDAGFTVKVNGTERRIPANDVAVIDLGAAAMRDADWEKIPKERQVVILKNGDNVQGRLVDIGGSSPLRMTIRTASGDRDIPSSEIAHIILARPSNLTGAPDPGNSGNSSTSGLAPATGAGLRVSPKQAWTATGISVKKDEFLSFNANGDIQLSADVNDVATPFGSKSGRKAPRSPLPNVLAGALIGRIGTTGQPFAIGSGVTIKMPGEGYLFLGVNDDGFEDNVGEFRVDIGRRSRR